MEFVAPEFRGKTFGFDYESKTIREEAYQGCLKSCLSFRLEPGEAHVKQYLDKK